MRLIRRIAERAHEDNTHPRRILIADDDPSIGTLIQVTLKDPRYEIVAVKNGLEALKAFNESKFDVVILDVMMPYVDGFEACQRIRERSDVPIIILTARDDPDGARSRVQDGGSLSRLPALLCTAHQAEQTAAFFRAR